MSVMRSLLFVPANRENMIARAHETEADVIVLDLEDGVPPAEKETARKGLRAAMTSLKAAGKTVHVRINHLDSGLAAEDLAAAVSEDLDGIVHPKTESNRDVRYLDVMIREQETRNGVRPGTPILIPHIETARAVLRCEEIAAASTRIAGISFGAYDYTADLGVARTPQGREMEHIRHVIVTCCAAYGLQALDSVYGDFADLHGLIQESEYVRSIGFKGKYIIHPNQAGPVNQAFAPAPEEIEVARRIVAALDAAIAEGRGAVEVDGRMVDAPVARRARDLIAYADTLAAHAGK